MKFLIRFLMTLLFAGLPLAGQAAATAGSSKGISKASNDHEKILLMLEYHQRMVKNTEAYLRDRAKIPADYQDVADKEYLRRAKLEKPLATIKAQPKVEAPAPVAPYEPFSATKIKK
jgi:hypothetical protein